MKTIILFLLFSSIAYAGNYYPAGKSGAKTVYSKEAKCEAKEGQACYSISGKNTAYYVLGQIDDLASPKYLKQASEVCLDQASCAVIHAAKDCSAFAGSFSVVAGDYTEVYCAEPNGYNQKPGLVIDATLKAAYDAAKAAKATEENSRKTKRTTRKNKLKACAKMKLADMTDDEQKKCIKHIAKELMRSELLESEL